MGSLLRFPLLPPTPHCDGSEREREKHGSLASWLTGWLADAVVKLRNDSCMNGFLKLRPIDRIRRHQPAGYQSSYVAIVLICYIAATGS